jgi:hypothetical protein
MALKLGKNRDLFVDDFYEQYARMKAELEVDRNALDDEVMQHPVKFQEVQEAYVHYATMRDTASVAADEEYSHAAGRMRGGLVNKVTEAQVKEGANLDDKYLAALALFQDAKKRADLMAALVKSYESRGKLALPEACRLFLAGYFQRDSVSGEPVRDMKAREAEEIQRELTKQRKLGNKSLVKRE